MNNTDQPTEDFSDLEQQLRMIQPAPLSDRLMAQIDTQLFGADLAQHRPAALSAAMLDDLENLTLEEELKHLRPQALSKPYLDQLANIPTEVNLASTKPASLSPDLLDMLSTRLDAIEAGTEAAPALQDNVIPFPTQTRTQKTKGTNWKWFATTAAVACVGIFCGLTIKPSNVPTVAYHNAHNDIGHNGNSNNLLNVSTESTVLQAQDQGIVPFTDQSSVKYRSVRVVEIETYTMKDQSGKTIQVNRPVQKTVLMPVSAD